MEFNFQKYALQFFISLKIARCSKQNEFGLSRKRLSLKETL